MQLLTRLHPFLHTSTHTHTHSLSLCLSVSLSLSLSLCVSSFLSAHSYYCLQSMNTGLDQEMPGFSYFNGSGLNASLRSGALKMSKVDDSVLRILTGLFSIELFDKPNTNTPANNMASAAHHETAGELSAAGTVLLVNRGNILPLCPPIAMGPLCRPQTRSTSGTSSIITPHAVAVAAAAAPSLNYTIAVIGHEALGVTVAGGGSGHVNPANLTGPLAAIRARFGISQDTNQPCVSSAGNTSVCVRFADTTKADDIPNAVALAQKADVAIVFVATSAAEGLDRSNLSLSASCQSTVGGACTNPYPTLDQDQLIHAITTAAGAKTAVVAVSPGAILTPWADDAAAVLAAFMPGQAFGEAITALLFGERSPSAKLPVTFPRMENDQNISQQQYPGYTNANLSLPIQRSCNFNCASLTYFLSLLRNLSIYLSFVDHLLCTQVH